MHHSLVAHKTVLWRDGGTACCSTLNHQSRRDRLTALLWVALPEDLAELYHGQEEDEANVGQVPLLGYYCS